MTRADDLIEPGPEMAALAARIEETNDRRAGEGLEPLDAITISAERAERLAAELHALPCYAIARIENSGREPPRYGAARDAYKAYLAAGGQGPKPAKKPRALRQGKKGRSWFPLDARRRP